MEVVVVVEELFDDYSVVAVMPSYDAAEKAYPCANGHVYSLYTKKVQPWDQFNATTV